MNDHSLLNIRYVGFESLSDTGRRLEYAITGKGMSPRRAVVEIPAFAFSGPNRVTFQDSAAIGYEKLRREISAGGLPEDPLFFILTSAEIKEYRPRRRAAEKKT